MEQEGTNLHLAGMSGDTNFLYIRIVPTRPWVTRLLTTLVGSPTISPNFFQYSAELLGQAPDLHLPARTYRYHSVNSRGDSAGQPQCRPRLAPYPVSLHRPPMAPGHHQPVPPRQIIFASQHVHSEAGS